MLKNVINAMLNTLKQNRYKLGIITNGFTELQQIRLERLGLHHHFDILITSEQVGHAKPHKAIFEAALDQANNPSLHRVLMVGDNPDSDIVGGMHAGLHTCWFNPNNRDTPNNIQPTYVINTYTELEKILSVDKY